VRYIAPRVLGLECTCHDTETLEITCSNCVLSLCLLLERDGTPRGWYRERKKSRPRGREGP